MHRTEIERNFLAAKDFNTNFVQFLPPNHVLISNMYVCSFTCTISHVHGHARKTVLCTRNLVYKNCHLWRPDKQTKISYKHNIAGLDWYAFKFVYELDTFFSYNAGNIFRAGSFLEHLGESKVNNFLSCNQPLTLQHHYKCATT